MSEPLTHGQQQELIAKYREQNLLLLERIEKFEKRVLAGVDGLAAKELELDEANTQVKLWEQRYEALEQESVAALEKFGAHAQSIIEPLTEQVKGLTEQRDDLLAAADPESQWTPAAEATMEARNYEWARAEVAEAKLAKVLETLSYAVADQPVAWWVEERVLKMLRELPTPVAESVVAPVTALQRADAAEAQPQMIDIFGRAAVVTPASYVIPPAQGPRGVSGPTGPQGPEGKLSQEDALVLADAAQLTARVDYIEQHLGIGKYAS